MTTQLTPAPAPDTTARRDHIYPALTVAQLARIATHGRRRRVEAREVLVHAGEPVARLFVVVEGQIDGVRPSATQGDLVVSLGPGMFTGEVTMLSGRRGRARRGAGAAGEVIEVARDDLLALMQADGELSEIFMRAFILRRMELLRRQVSDVVVLGSSHCQGTLHIREFLTRNGHPYTMVDLDREADVEAVLDRFHVSADDVPVVICRDVLLRSPSTQQIADALGFNDAIDQTHVRDLVIVGAGPAGLAAAVYGASEGLDVVGAGNAAGQAAVFLAQTARRVHMVIRSGGLVDTMSRYLIRRIEDHPAIVRHVRTEVVSLEGNGHLERVGWRDNETGRIETHGIRHVFTMTGAVPGTHWLGGCLALDAKGFIKTGPDLSPEDLAAARWPLSRAPHLLETSLPGVFAIGDVRAGSLKRVASAVGEGPIAIAAVHQVLHE